MRILVTGGAGYIGSHAVRTLARSGHEVVIYDNFSTGHHLLAGSFSVVEGELGDAQTLSRALRGIDAVMHFAAHAYVGESVTDPRRYFSNNVRCGLVLLDTMLDCDVRKIIFSSSCAVYGIPSVIPITEAAPRNPVNPYGVTKRFFEDALAAYEVAYGLKYASLRYFNAAGADDGGEIGELHDPETHLIPRALQAAAGLLPQLDIFGSDYETPDGTCVRDYIHVTDLAEAHGLALEYLCHNKSSAALNLGTGTGHSIRQVVKTVEEVTGRRVPTRYVERRPGDPPVLVADPSRAQQVLRWKATRDVTDMISSAWKWLVHLDTRCVS